MNDNPKYVIVGLFDSPQSASGFPTEDVDQAREKIQELQDQGCNDIRIFHLGKPVKFSSGINASLISE